MTPALWGLADFTERNGLQSPHKLWAPGHPRTFLGDGLCGLFLSCYMQS